MTDRRLIIVLEGGLIQAVVSPDEELVGVHVVIVDYDTEGSSDRVGTVKQADGTRSEAVLSSDVVTPSTIGVDELFRQLDAQDVGDPYEIAATAQGWVRDGDNGGIIYNVDHYDSWKAAVSWAPAHGQVYDTWQEVCEQEGIEVSK